MESLPRSLEILLCEKRMLARLGLLSKKCCSTSTIWLCDRSMDWRAGRTMAPVEMVCSWLWERFRWVREGRPTNTKEWRTWGRNGV